MKAKLIEGINNAYVLFTASANNAVHDSADLNNIVKKTHQKMLHEMRKQEQVVTGGDHSTPKSNRM